MHIIQNQAQNNKSRIYKITRIFQTSYFEIISLEIFWKFDIDSQPRISTLSIWLSNYSLNYQMNFLLKAYNYSVG